MASAVLVLPQRSHRDGQVSVGLMPSLGWEWFVGVTGPVALLTISAVRAGFCCFLLCLQLCSLKTTSSPDSPCWPLRSPSHGPPPMPRPLPVLRGEWGAVLPVVPTVGRHGPGCALQYCQLRPAHLHDRTHHGPEGGLLWVGWRWGPA